MPRRSTILELPEELREALNARLVRTGFRDYSDLELWLNGELEARGLELRVSRSAIHRHGKAFEERLERMRVATEQAKAIAEGAEDDEGAMNEALIRLVQSHTFDVLSGLQEVDVKDLKHLGLVVARSVRESVRAKEYRREARERAERAVESIRRTASKGGLSQDAIETIEAEVLGIVR